MTQIIQLAVTNRKNSVRAAPAHYQRAVAGDVILAAEVTLMVRATGHPHPRTHGYPPSVRRLRDRRDKLDLDELRDSFATAEVVQHNNPEPCDRGGARHRHIEERKCG